MKACDLPTYTRIIENKGYMSKDTYFIFYIHMDNVNYAVNLITIIVISFDHHYIILFRALGFEMNVRVEIFYSIRKVYTFLYTKTIIA